MTVAQFDHLVLGAQTLAQGIAFVERRFGVTPTAGGKHARMGTHNALLGLGEGCYLEILAVDPEGQKPSQARWFGLDDETITERLARGPGLLGWVARCSDIAASRLACPIDPGSIHAMSRGEFRWRITIAPDGLPPAHGVLPILIQWDVPFHPSQRLPDCGCRLRGLSATHPESPRITNALSALGLAEALLLRHGEPIELRAELTAPSGTIILT